MEEENVKEENEKFPILALTATSTIQSRSKIAEIFTISNENITFSQTHLHPNISLTISFSSTRIKNLQHLLSLKSIKHKKPLLIYCNFKKTTEIVATTLKQNGINAMCFNSNLTDLERLNILQQFLSTDIEMKKKRFS